MPPASTFVPSRGAQSGAIVPLSNSSTKSSAPSAEPKTLPSTSKRSTAELKMGWEADAGRTNPHETTTTRTASPAAYRRVRMVPPFAPHQGGRPARHRCQGVSLLRYRGPVEIALRQGPRADAHLRTDPTTREV